MKEEPSIKLIDIDKIFSGVKALSAVSLEIRKGEIHTLCGENGAGKSTLMKILTGNHTPDAGRIFIKGKETIINNQKHAQEMGISIVYQERSLVANLNVAENIFAGNQPHNKWGFIDQKKLITQTTALFEKLNLNIKPDIKVSQLSPGLQQMVEIAKALSQNPDILILDEPTSSITETETRILFSIIKDLKNKGVSIIYISHRMSEIFQISDRISILKDGHLQGTFNKEETNIEAIIKLMVGRKISQFTFESQSTKEGLFKVENLCGRGFNNISFEVNKGEVVALAGLIGAGRTEIARTIFGADPALSGAVYLEGNKLQINHPSDAIRYNIGYLPEERKAQGLFMNMSVAENIVAGKLKSASSFNIIKWHKVSEIASSFSEKLRIKASSIKQKVADLSGGNQQKIVLARWLLHHPKLLIVDEPTHGVDIGAKTEIYEILNHLVKTGVGIILISSELPEVLALSDRILVLRNGEIAAELNKHKTSEEEIIAYASGIKTTDRMSLLTT